MKLTPHPRLYVSPERLARLKQKPDHPVLAAAAREVARLAAGFLGSTAIEYDPTGHNALLIRARMMQTRVLTLLVRHFQTDEARYRSAALRHVRAMARWKYWSWITMRQKDPRPNATTPI